MIWKPYTSEWTCTLPGPEYTIQWRFFSLCPLIHCQVGTWKTLRSAEYITGTTRWRFLARSRVRAVSRKKHSFVIPYNKLLSDHACSVKMGGYWPLIFYRIYGPPTPFRSINTKILVRQSQIVQSANYGSDTVVTQVLTSVVLSLGSQQ